MRNRFYAKAKTFVFILTCLSILATIGLSCSSKIKKNEVYIYFVRHAEKDLSDPANPDPVLTVEGEARAQQLLIELEDVKFESIYSTSYYRTINTVKPIADDQKIELTPYSPHDFHPILDILKQRKGKAFLICGHGDNILPMIDYLGLERPIEELGHEEYDKIFKVRLSSDTNSIEMLTY